jgi:signal transduction histidine kinase
MPSAPRACIWRHVADLRGFRGHDRLVRRAHDGIDPRARQPPGAAREQALRDERVVALGALAAGAAHELGTPLATMAVLVGELEQEPCLDADARADLALVREQIALCKGIISGMAARSGVLRPDALQAQDAGAWLRAFARAGMRCGRMPSVAG